MMLMENKNSGYHSYKHKRRNIMKKVNKILVACDLSNYSIQAVEYAADMAESVNAELVILNVITSGIWT